MPEESAGQSVGEGQRLAETCPGCGMDGPFRGGGRFTRKRTSSTLEGDGRVETWERWMRVECPDCDTVFATLEKTVRTRYTEEEKEHEVLTDGGESVSRTDRSDPPAIVEEWAARAKSNVEEWGLQDYETLLLAIQEELGELTQAYLEAEHEGGSTSAIDEELADLAALVIQLHYRQAEEYWVVGEEIRTDGGHRHATDRVDGTVIAECPNLDEDPDGHLSFEVEYSDAADTTIFEELMETWPECGECGAELEAVHHQEPSEVLTDGGQPVGSTWLGRGTWLIDRRGFGSTIGVITEVRGEERELAARIGVRWRRPNSYENLSIATALEHFKSGDWRVDDA